MRTLDYVLSAQQTCLFWLFGNLAGFLPELFLSSRFFSRVHVDYAFETLEFCEEISTLSLCDLNLAQVCVFIFINHALQLFYNASEAMRFKCFVWQLSSSIKVFLEIVLVKCFKVFTICACCK